MKKAIKKSGIPYELRGIGPIRYNGRENGMSRKKHKKKKNSRRLQDAVRILVLLVAFSILLYPTVSNYLYQKNQSRVISSYDEDAVKRSNQENEKMLADARAYNREMLSNIELLDPFGPGKKEINEYYESLLNVNGSGMMGYIRIPAIEVELPIYHGTSESVLQVGVGHFEGTSLPVGGESTHAVLTGHRGLPSKLLFTDMDKLKKGDVFYIKILGETFAYEIDQILTVLPEDTKALSIDSGKDYVTLVTCTPYAVNTHRLLVRGHRIPYEEAIQTTADVTVEAELPFQVKVLIGASILLVMIFIVSCIYASVQKKKKAGKQKQAGRNKNV